MTKKNEIDLKNKMEKYGIFSIEENTIKNLYSDKVVSTGSFLLDRALGIGGWPSGKMIEIFGNDSSGKSTLALHAVAEAQKQQKICVYIDLENTINKQWAKKIGVDLENLYISKPENGERAFSVINELVKDNSVDLIIVDSVAAMVPNLEFENNIEDQTMGLHARLMSKGLRILQSNLISSKTTVIFINQVREKIGTSFIPITTTTGGRALRYASCIRVEIKRCESIKQGEKVIGFNTKAIVVKNKYGAPMQTANLGLYFCTGFSYYHEIVNEAINKKIINKNGSWFSFQQKNLGQGINVVIDFLKENIEIFKQIEEKTKQEN